MDIIKRVIAPLSAEAALGLKAGDMVALSGVIYTARDAAHKRLLQALDGGLPLPFGLDGQVLYYVGPCPAKPPRPFGPCGPTTSFRMDSYTPRLLDLGLKGMIGKGQRSPDVIASMKKNAAVYFAAIGGAAATISRSVKKAEAIAYEDLGPEAIYRLEVEGFPCIVAIDTRGASLYDLGPEMYRR
ncbi:MAG: Fe-S-containing hydro-lyase [Clostridiales Family XIII bacterium]|jgi:fumarate hydratase subunit beta|nr:Fe-S-containing hydro-lyase [Clostridiales Family XIII bacterium]